MSRIVELSIMGMHCVSCEVLVERKLKHLPGVDRVNVNHITGKVKLHCTTEPDTAAINKALEGTEYRIDNLISKSKGNSYELKRDHLEAGAIFIILFGAYLFLKQFNLLPNIGVTDNMSYGLIFLIGIVAALSTCLAVSGGLLLSISAKYNQENPNLTGIQKFKPHIYFNLGRVISYTVLGGLVGLLGSVIAFSSTMNGYLVLAASIVMILLGLQMLGIFSIPIKIPKFIAHRVFDAHHSKNAPFLFGASTFFFPCGFTQALQLYALSKGSFTIGALTMLVFSLGTLPSLLSIGAISSFAKGNVQKYFVKGAAVLVILLSFASIKSGLALIGVLGVSNGNNNVVQVVDSNQVVNMQVSGLDYYPNSFTIKKGVPVEWRVDGRQANGCAGLLIAPNLGITQRLSRTDITVIRFTPQKKGKIRFTCGMGMAGPGEFNVI
ncbi:MAG: sulfite exporter TauE/SafE family protein [Nanoarchaeota archaeon]